MNTKEENQLLRRRVCFAVQILTLPLSGFFCAAALSDQEMLFSDLALVLIGITLMIIGATSGIVAIASEHRLGWVQHRNKLRRDKIAATIAEHERSGAYEVAEHQTSDVLLEMFKEQEE